MDPDKVEMRLHCRIWFTSDPPSGSDLFPSLIRRRNCAWSLCLWELFIIRFLTTFCQKFFCRRRRRLLDPAWPTPPLLKPRRSAHMCAFFLFSSKLLLGFPWVHLQCQPTVNRCGCGKVYYMFCRLVGCFWSYPCSLQPSWCNLLIVSPCICPKVGVGVTFTKLRRHSSITSKFYSWDWYHYSIFVN